MKTLETSLGYGGGDSCCLLESRVVMCLRGEGGESGYGDGGWAGVIRVC